MVDNMKDVEIKIKTKTEVSLFKGLCILLMLLLPILLLYTLNWIIFCGILKIITLILGLNFSWVVSTIIWLVLNFLCYCLKKISKKLKLKKKLKKFVKKRKKKKAKQNENKKDM